MVYANHWLKREPLALVILNGSAGTAAVDMSLKRAERQGLLSSIQHLVQDLLSNTRQQYQDSLSTSDNAASKLSDEQKAVRTIVIAFSGLSLATAGMFISPLFYFPTVVCILYSWLITIRKAYHKFIEENRIDFRIVWVLTLFMTFSSGLIWTAALGTIFTAFATYLAAKTENHSKQNIINLFDRQTRTAWLLINGVEVEKPIEQVRMDDIVVVYAGQVIPVDGELTMGTATIDQHMLTGEAQPAEKGVGDKVLATTVVLAGRIHVKVEEAGDATVAAEITRMLSQTTDFKRTLQSRTERWLNRICLPIIGLSLLAWPLAGISGAAAVLWYYPGGRMLSFGPLSMLTYLQIAAQRRILVKDGRALEVLHEIDTVVFDKTGTLTLEQPTLIRIIGYNGYDHESGERDLLRYAAAAEAKQSHPIALAILQAAAEQGLALPPLADAQYKVGYGLKTEIDSHIIWVGSFRFMTMEGIAVPPELIALQAESQIQGHSLVLVALSDKVVEAEISNVEVTNAKVTSAKVIGAIELQPTIRPEVKEIIRSLHKRDIKTVIISGDHETPTHQLATKLGIERYFAEVLPEDKAKLVEQLQAEGHKVCFIGDGINDSLALRAADVSVSLRGATTIATDMAEIVFMDGTLSQLTMLFTLADEFAANMRFNFLAATIPGVVGIAGTLLFSWGLTLSVLLSQCSMPVGIYNALKPLIDERSNHMTA